MSMKIDKYVTNLSRRVWKIELALEKMPFIDVHIVMLKTLKSRSVMSL